jgi:hypothetical protein
MNFISFFKFFSVNFNFLFCLSFVYTIYFLQSIYILILFNYFVYSNTHKPATINYIIQLTLVSAFIYITYVLIYTFIYVANRCNKTASIFQSFVLSLQLFLSLILLYLSLSLIYFLSPTFIILYYSKS